MVLYVIGFSLIGGSIVLLLVASTIFWIIVLKIDLYLKYFKKIDINKYNAFIKAVTYSPLSFFKLGQLDILADKQKEFIRIKRLIYVFIAAFALYHITLIALVGFFEWLKH